jgi:hypothetical protein
MKEYLMRYKLLRFEQDEMPDTTAEQSHAKEITTTNTQHANKN